MKGRKVKKEIQTYKASKWEQTIIFLKKYIDEEEIKLQINTLLITFILVYIPIAYLEIFVFENNLWKTLIWPLALLFFFSSYLYNLFEGNGALYFVFGNGIIFFSIVLPYKMVESFGPTCIYNLLIIALFILFYSFDWKIFWREKKEAIG